MKFVQQRIITLALFLAISTAALIPLISPFLKPGRAWTYDVDYHAFRMAAFHNAVLEGEIPPRWSSQLVYGWGSPLFSYNWSLPYWVAEPFLFAGWSITDSSKAVVILSVALSYLVMFFFLKEWFEFWPALGGAVVYEWSLFRVYLLFTGGGLGMQMAFIFWPILFWAVRLVKKKPRLSFFLMSISTALLMLSHQVMFLLIQPLWWIFIFITFWHDALGKRLPMIILAFLSGLGLSAYFWLPAFLEQQFIHIAMTEMLYKNNFLDLVTIFHQPGITDRIPPLQYWYWSTGWNLFAVALVASIILLQESKHRIIWLFVLFFVVGQFFMTRASAVFWETVPLLANFIYPVRFQAVSLFCGSILTAYLISWARHTIAWMLCLLLVALTVGINILAIPTNWPRDVISDGFYERGDSTVDMMGEYLPRWANISHFFADAERFERHPIARIVEGSGVVEHMMKGQSEATFTVRADAPVSVVINQFYFPGWQITANGKHISYEVYGNGEMLVHLPKGVSSVAAQFADTPIRTFGNSISIVTVTAMVFYLIRIVWKKRRSVS